MNKKQWIISQTAKHLHELGFDKNVIDTWVKCADMTSITRANRIVRRAARKAERTDELKKLRIALDRK